jgi:2-alkyl-3-oxoalkanoate reductase
VKIAVTRAEGTIGRAVVARARAAGHEVVAVASTRNRHALDPATFAGCEVVIDGDSRAPELGPEAGFRAADGEVTRQLLTAARASGVARIVLLSSLAVHDLDGGERVDVRRREYARGRFGYPRALRRVEELVLGAPGLEGVIVRPGLWTIGVGDPVVTRLARALRGGRLPLIGGGSGRLNLVAADDLAEGVLACATTPRAAGAIYAIADPTPLTWREVLTTFASLVGGGPPRRLLDQAPLSAVATVLERAWGFARPASDDSLTHFRLALLGQGLHVTCDAARDELDWRARTPWRDTLRAAAADALGRAGLAPQGRR